MSSYVPLPTRSYRLSCYVRAILHGRVRDGSEQVVALTAPILLGLALIAALFGDRPAGLFPPRVAAAS